MKYLIFILTILCFGSLSPAQFSNSLNEEILRNKLFLENGFNSQEDQANLLRKVSSIEFEMDKFVADKKIPNKLKHLIVQTDNVLDIGFLDAAIKASWAQQYSLHGDPFWAYNNFYGRSISLIQGASITEYAINQSNDWVEFTRFFLAQAAISSVVEHLGFWIYVNSSVPVVKNGDLMGWRGNRYPEDHSGKNNDVPWMHETPAGWSSRIFFGDSKGTVRSEAVFLSLPILYGFAYLITPDKGFVKQNKFTNFKYIIYTDGVDYNNTTGLWGGTKLGLKYELENFSLAFYSSHELDARGEIFFKFKKLEPSLTLGTDNQGNIGVYGASISIENPLGFFSLNYRKDSLFPIVFSSVFDLNS